MKLLEGRTAEAGHVPPTIHTGVNPIEVIVKPVQTPKPTRKRRVVRNPTIDKLIEEGPTLDAIGTKVGRTRQGVMLYIVETGQYEKWIEAKKRIKAKRGELSGQLIYILKARQDDIFQKEPWASQKAIQYITSRRKHPEYPYETIRAFFKRYSQAKINSEILSLEELCKGLGMSTQNAGRILKKVGEDPMHGSRYRHVLPKEKKEALKRGFSLEMPVADIAYFIKVSEHTATRTFSRIGARAAYKPLFVTKNNECLDYRQASQIYEAQDALFRRDEIAQLLDTNNKIVDHAIKNRRIYEQRIIEALRILYNSNSIDKPYLVKK